MRKAILILFIISICIVINKKLNDSFIEDCKNAGYSEEYCVMNQ